MAAETTCPVCRSRIAATGWDDPPGECRACEDWPRCESCDEPTDPDDIKDYRCDACRADISVRCDICGNGFDAPYSAEEPHLCETCAPSGVLEVGEVLAIISRVSEDLRESIGREHALASECRSLRAECDRLRRMLDDLRAVAADPRTATASPETETQPMRAMAAKE